MFAFQTAEVAIPRNLFADILRLIAELRAHAAILGPRWFDYVPHLIAGSEQ